MPVPEHDLEYNWAIASNAAVAKMMLYMYDKNLKAADKLLIEDMEKANLKEMSATINVEIVDRSVAFGKKWLMLFMIIQGRWWS